MAVDLSAFPRKLISDHQMVNRNMRDVDVGPRMLNGNPNRETPINLCVAVACVAMACLLVQG